MPAFPAPGTSQTESSIAPPVPLQAQASGSCSSATSSRCSMSNTHGPVMARQAKTILSGGLQLAVMANVLGANPVREVQPIESKRPPKGAPALTADQLRDLLTKLRTSEYCRKHDLIGPFTLFVATGLRRGELLGLRWSDFDETEGTIAVTGKVERAQARA